MTYEELAETHERVVQIAARAPAQKGCRMPVFKMAQFGLQQLFGGRGNGTRRGLKGWQGRLATCWRS